MPLSKSGSFHMNPGNARMHDASVHSPDMGKGTSTEPEHHPSHSVTVHKHHAGHFTVHPHGMAEHSTHQDADEALASAKEHLGGNEGEIDDRLEGQAEEAI